MRIYLLSSIFMLLQTLIVFGQEKIQRIEPINWWVGMKDSKLQLILYGQGIGKLTAQSPKAGFRLLKQHQVENPNYLFLDMEIAADAKSGEYPIQLFNGDKQVFNYGYQLMDRNQDQVKAQGLNASDFIYLIMPDRFANGNPKNDQVKGMREMAVNRDSMYYRHGGDLQGLIGKLDYLKELGITAVWLTPVLSNDMPQASYHGYANTENYHIDPRFGSNQDYQNLGTELHKRGMKLVHDVVPNHVGIYHWTVVDKPFSDWLHEWPTFTQTTYKDQTIFDPYGAKEDKELMEKGWFVKTMPDMNQQNPFVANYITQSHIWWIEYAGVDGFRIDTYPYNDLQFMANWTDRIRREYPNFSFFGETWVPGIANQAYFLGGQQVGQPMDTKLEGVTDFQLNYAISDALKEHKDGANRLYSTLGADYLYPNPYAHVLFLDNHDKDRFFSVVGENLEKYKSAMSWLLTYRGIPQIYYGAEILMKNFNNPDGLLREDFKGGFPGDKVDKFHQAGRTAQEEDIFRHIQKLANFRKNNPVLQTGKLQHYVPVDNIYVYFRYNDSQKIMVVMNLNSDAKSISLDRFDRMIGSSSPFDLLTDKKETAGDISLKPFETKIYKLQNK